MQHDLRHEIVRAIFHAEPIDMENLEEPVETELTLAARQSISNAGDVLEGEAEFEEGDFNGVKNASKVKSTAKKRTKANKAERRRKSAARRRK
jgi:hypothetical protein